MRKESGPFLGSLFRRYRLSLENEEREEELLSLYVSRIGVALVLAGVFVLLVAVGFFAGRATAARKADSNAERMSEMELRVDSLSERVRYQNVFIENLRRALSSEFPYDTIPLAKAAGADARDRLNGASEDELDFRRSYEKEYRQRTGKTLKIKKNDE